MKPHRALAPPGEDEARELGGSAGLMDHDSQQLDSGAIESIAQARRDAVAAHDKRVTTLQAQFALKGFSMCILSDAFGRPLYSVSRWGMVRDFATVDELERFAVQVGVAP